MMKRNARFGLSGLLLLALQIGLPAARGELERANLAQNAALGYWKAISLMQYPINAEELSTYAFIEDSLIDLPPQILGVRQDAGTWLMQERPMILALSQAVEQPVCAFDLETNSGQGLNLTHLVKLRRMARRALNVCKAYEYIDNTETAALVYTHLFTLCKHLDQDNNVTSGIAGAEIVQAIVAQLEGFYSRKPSLEAIESLNLYFKELDPSLFHLNDYIREEARRNAEWLNKNPERFADALKQLYGDIRPMTALQVLARLAPEDRVRQVREWTDGYVQYMEEVAVASEKPYLLGVEMIRYLDEQAVDPDEENVELKNNPLIPLLVKPKRDVYERFKLAEAQIAMIRIMGYAAHYRELIGQGPANMELLETFSNNGLPLDPFSGKTFHYQYREGPRIVTRVPKRIAKTPSLLYSLDLEKRKELDQVTYASAVKVLRRKNLIDPVQGDNVVPR